MALGPYGWPLRPFARAHPVRGYFNDPRISGRSRAFHFGIDIAARDGQPVYAVEAGTAHLEGRRSLSVVAAGGRAFGYWHVVPAVRHRQEVRRHQLLGHVEEPWGHVHFAESRGGVYRDPLRPGALTPWADATSPRIARLVLVRGRKEVPPDRVHGAVDVLCEAYDVPPLRVPPPWNDLPVTPAKLRWRILRPGGKTARGWHTPVDLSRRLLPRELFEVVYAPGTRQNHAGEPGRYVFYLAHSWSTRLLPDGYYRLEAEARDERGNIARARLPFTLVNRL
jgi:hypothetical protein